MDTSSPYADLAPLCGPDHTWLSLFVDLDDRRVDPHDRADAAIEVARERGATDALLTRAREPLLAPVPDGIGGRAVVVSDDGTLHHEDGPEGPGVTRAFLGPLPRLGPILEWRQSVVAHAAITVMPSGVELVTFPAEGEGSIIPLGPTTGDAVDAVRAAPLADSALTDMELIVLDGEDTALDRIRRALAEVVPATTEIRVAEPGITLADSVVRHVSDVAARRTVGALNEFRFQRTHDAAVDGIDGVVAALARGHGDLLLVHDDPLDERMAWFGPGSSDIALEAGPTTPTEGRLVDIAMRLAILQDKAIRVIPSTGERGPAGDLAVVARDPAARF